MVQREQDEAMALPIKETPILTGKAAREFLRRAKKAETEAVPREEYLRAKKVYDDCVKAWGKDWL